MAGKIYQRKPKSNFRLAVEALNPGEGIVIARGEIDAKLGVTEAPSGKVYGWAREAGRKYSVKALVNDEYAIVRKS